MRIDDLPENRYISLKFPNGPDEECRILEQIVYDGQAYAICKNVEKASFNVADVRTIEGQNVPVGDAVLEEVLHLFFKEHPEQIWVNREGTMHDMEERIVVLTDDHGQPMKMELLDYFEVKRTGYVVLLDVEDEDADEVVILEVENEEDEAITYQPIQDEVLLSHLFEVFKERNREDFEFI